MFKESFGLGQTGLQGHDQEASGKLFKSPGGRNAGAPKKHYDPDHAPIIVHSHLRWDFVWQRPQQIFSRLAKHHRILFVEEPKWDEWAHRLEISEPYPNVVRVVPVVAGGPELEWDAQCDLIMPMLQEAMRAHPLLAEQFESPIQWFYSPMPAPRLLGQFNASRVVYDCMDELANFRFAPPDISQREQQLLGKADVVFTGGYQLFQSKSRHHDNVHFYGCGVDVDHYGKARQEKTELPASVADLPRPIFGYFGVVDERLDYELLATLADGFPQASIVMAGPLAKVEQKDLPQRSNIHWLGQQAYDDLPALVKAFDVCLMPFALNEATQYINPTKTLEYMAAGKPVVSTAVPDVIRNFTPVVDVAHTYDEFIGAVKRAFKTPDAALIREGVERASLATWEAIVGAMRGHLLDSLNTSQQAAIASRPVNQ